MLPDISDYTNMNDIVILFFAIVTLDTIVLFLTRYFPNFFGKPLNDWYDMFQLNAVLCDVLSILIGFLITRYVYTAYFKPTYGFNTWLFLAILVIVQAIHDVLFYFLVIEPIPRGHNKMIDVFKDYAKAGPKIIAGDSLLMLGSAAIAFFYKSQPTHVFASFSALASYALTYILYTKPQFF